jgi:hypothetical protein
VQSAKSVGGQSIGTEEITRQKDIAPVKRVPFPMAVFCDKPLEKLVKVLEVFPAMIGLVMMNVLYLVFLSFFCCMDWLFH